MNPEQTLLVFPGQGSQQPGMGSEFMSHPATSEIFEQANSIVGYNLAEIMKEGDPEKLRQTAITQPALFVCSYAAFSYFAHHAGKGIKELAKYVAGHSLGEYTALVAAGAFDFETGLKLVKARGEAMQNATAKDEGAMAAIIGIPLHQVETFCHSTGAFLANDNCEGQAVIAGLNRAVDEASNIAAMEQPKKIMRLDVSGPFHTPMMYPAAEKMQEVFSAVKANAPQVPVIMNVTAEPCTDAIEVVPRLVQQITQRVRWRESMIYAANNGITQVIELGSGKVLAGLAKRCDDRLKATSLGSPWDIDSYLADNEG